MNEQLLQYLWKHSLVNPVQLETTSGEPVVIIFPGKYNAHAGPDFLEAKIKIGTTVWAGNVELHVRTSDWTRHKHEHNENYKNIILHVVYQNDVELDNVNFPTLALESRIDAKIIERYFNLITFQNYIPCSARLHQIPEIVWYNWQERLLAERWEQKLAEWQLVWEETEKDWRTLLYYRLAANFGFHVNKDAFLNLAMSIPLNILTKYRNNLLQTEALLFGQSGLLQAAIPDAYTKSLEAEYHFLRRKHQLIPLEPHKWKFLRLRPQNFPTIRIAQFAMLVHKSLGLFAQMMEIEKVQDLSNILSIEASTYWNNHYRFGEAVAEKKVKHLGNDAIQNIVINTVAPMQFLYAKMQSGNQLLESSLKLLHSVKAERNNVMTTWNTAGVKPKNAAESQALLQLFQNYCSQKQCLQCAIGHRLVRKE